MMKKLLMVLSLMLTTFALTSTLTFAELEDDIFGEDGDPACGNQCCPQCDLVGEDQDDTFDGGGGGW